MVPAKDEERDSPAGCGQSELVRSLVDGLEAHLKIGQASSLVFLLDVTQTSGVLHVDRVDSRSVLAKFLTDIAKVSAEHIDETRLSVCHTILVIIFETVLGLLQVFALALEFVRRSWNSVRILKHRSGAQRAQLEFSQVTAPDATLPLHLRNHGELQAAQYYFYEHQMAR